MRALPTEADEQIAGTLTTRVMTAITRYGDTSLRQSQAPVLEHLLLRGVADQSLPYGRRKSQLDAYIALAQTQDAQVQLDMWLDADSVFGIPLQAPTRWAMITRLLATDADGGLSRYNRESTRDSTSEGRRQAFVAQAAFRQAREKTVFFDRWFADSTLNEEWVTASLRTFHDPDHAALTQRFLRASLDTLPWIQKNRRIFFLSAWLNAAIGGQSSAAALAEVDAWLSSHPSLAPDLRRKVLQARDELERTVRIQRQYGGGRDTGVP
jgi:aminopeptidase N